MSENKLFNFYPRPEARALKWENLAPPVRTAVRTLLVMLTGAESQVEADPDLEVANCFLVNGERGTGKTSVLLNAWKAVETFNEHKNAGTFFSESQEDGKKSVDFLIRDANDNRKQVTLSIEHYNTSLSNSDPKKDQLEKKDAFIAASDLTNRVVWLDILDLESLQPETNLLTTLLTRIRAALHQTAEDREHELTSIFEAGEDSARHLLDQLIGDATLMWESIKDQDTRISANRQVHAAGIYAKFRSNFREAMDKLTKELGRPYGYDQRRSIILPIDNIDRSTDHLQNIVKLAQLVSHPRLWLVMAGGREDIDTFLERAYWKELIRNSGGSEGIGKTESRGEDETLTMARRQAAATAQKIWPSSHRIPIGLMEPDASLNFHPPGKNVNIEKLLEQVKVWTWIKQTDSEKHVSIPMLDWFKHASGLTQIAKFGLKLPIRSALELWQLVHCVVNDQTSFPENETETDQRAEQIARTMLRNAISESRISNRLSQRLQNEVISFDSTGATILNFTNLKLVVECLAPRDNELTLPTLLSSDTISPIKSCIRVRRGKDSFLRFKLVDGKGFEEALPELVSAWLALLYDVLRLEERLAILCPTTFQPPIMETHHAMVIQDENTRMREVVVSELRWPTPVWVTFRAHGVFWDKWCAFQEELVGIRKTKNSKVNRDDCFASYFALGWVHCVLDTYCRLIGLGKVPDKTSDKESNKELSNSPIAHLDQSSELLKRITIAFDNLTVANSNNAVEGTGENVTQDVLNELGIVLSRVAETYCELTSPDDQETYFYKQVICDWVVKDLPMFFSHWYFPDKNLLAKTYSETIGFLRKNVSGEKISSINKLLDKWQEEMPFIVANMDDRLREAFKVEPGATKIERKRLAEVHMKFWSVLQQDCKLHSLVNPKKPGVNPSQGTEIPDTIKK